MAATNPTTTTSRQTRAAGPPQKDQNLQPDINPSKPPIDPMKQLHLVEENHDYSIASDDGQTDPSINLFQPGFRLRHRYNENRDRRLLNLPHCEDDTDIQYHWITKTQHKRYSTQPHPVEGSSDADDMDDHRQHMRRVTTIVKSDGGSALACMRTLIGGKDGQPPPPPPP